MVISKFFLEIKFMTLYLPLITFLVIFYVFGINLSRAPQNSVFLKENIIEIDIKKLINDVFRWLLHHIRFFRPPSRPFAGFPRLLSTAPQIPVPVHIVNNVHQPYPRCSPRLPDTFYQGSGSICLVLRFFQFA
jgi:hypothetical protein